MTLTQKTNVLKALKSKRRIVIALDDYGAHFREILCTTHHDESGEVQYDAAPIGSADAQRQIRNAVAKIIKGLKT